jgi:Zn-dependent protease with chaperone function
MAGWLAWTCYRLLAAVGNGSDGGSVFIGIGARFLSLFLFWSIRSIVEVLFMGVVLAEKALSREMEFQADLC